MNISATIERTCATLRWTRDSTNSERSRIWVSVLAVQLRTHFPERLGYRVFSKDYPGNESTFRLRELLYDITVIRTATILSAVRNIDLEYPSEVLWQIESEFHERDSRASIVDFGKLLMGSAKHKLMILPADGKIEYWARENLPETRNSASGSMHLCFLPHPANWSHSNRPTATVEKLW